MVPGSLVAGLRAALRVASSSGASTSNAAAAAFGTYDSRDQGRNQWRDRRHFPDEPRHPKSRQQASYEARTQRSGGQHQDDVLKAQQRSSNAPAADEAWTQILESCGKSHQKLKSVVGDLHKHCIETTTSPPLHALNELLRLCYHWGARSSVFKLVEVMERNQMQIDEETHQRLRECFSYFPKSGVTD